MKTHISDFFKKYKRTMGASFLVGFLLFSAAHILAQTYVYPAGELHWDGNTGHTVVNNDYTCDSGYTLTGYHYESGNSDDATWYACAPNNDVPVSCSLQATYATKTFTWTATNAVSGTIAGVGAISPVSSGSESYNNMTSGATYTLTVTAANGNTNSCYATAISPPVHTCTKC